MIISTKKGTPQEELQKIISGFEAQGLEVTLIRGTDYNVFGLVGDTTKINDKVVAANPWVESVTRVSAPYKKANRLFHAADTVVDAAGVKIGGRENAASGLLCRIRKSECLNKNPANAGAPHPSTGTPLPFRRHGAGIAHEEPEHPLSCHEKAAEGTGRSAKRPCPRGGRTRKYLL